MLTRWWEEAELQDVWHMVEAERFRDVLLHAAAHQPIVDQVRIFYSIL